MEQARKDRPASSGANEREQALRQQQAARDRERMRREMAERQIQQAKDLEKAGKTIKGMAEDASEFSSFDLLAAPKPGLLQIFSKRSSTAALNNGMSFGSALAAAKGWGEIAPGDPEAGNGSITQILKQDFGNGKAKDPFHKGAQGLKSHQEGIPLLSSQDKIESALRRAGSDSQGLVFVDGGKDTPGYVFNALNNGGKVEFWDFQHDPPVQYKSFRSLPIKSRRVFFYRLY
jgi:hypothetical protein